MMMMKMDTFLVLLYFAFLVVVVALDVFEMI